ncbi:hypothetical protein V2J09_011623, partial [Rumex salicifolius]
VVIDNETCKNATVIQVDSANRHGILLEVVQILTDLNLTIRKAYISSDGGWFMDGRFFPLFPNPVFNVTDQEGNKITDEEVIDYIHKSLGPDSSSMDRSVGFQSISADYTSIELIGRDRPGLLSELSAALAHLGCNVVNAEIKPPHDKSKENRLNRMSKLKEKGQSTSATEQDDSQLNTKRIKSAQQVNTLEDSTQFQRTPLLDISYSKYEDIGDATYTLHLHSLWGDNVV